VVSGRYVGNELRRRTGRTIVTAIGLAAGVGLVMGIIGVSDGLSDAQARVLSPLSTVGTDLIVTRTVAPTTTPASPSSSSASENTPNGPGGSGRFGGGSGGGFFGRGAGLAGLSQLNTQDQQSLANANSSVLTDLSKLGPAGTKFTHDFFVPGTLITFPNQAASVIAAIANVSSVTGALSLQVTHESGTVPKITASFKTGGSTLNVASKPPQPTAAQQAATRACIQNLIKSAPAPAGDSGTTTFRRGGGGGRSGGGFFFAGGNSAFEKCLSPEQQAYVQKVVIPSQTITQIINPPSTNTETTTYTAGGVNPAATTHGLVTKSQVTSGHWFDQKATSEVLVTTSYASQHKLKVGQVLTINAKPYTIVGLVAPTLTGNISDLYFDLSTLQSLSSNPKRVNEVLVSVRQASDVSAVAKAIQKALPGAQVLTAKSLATGVSGSLTNAKKLANSLGVALAVVVILAAILIAALLTLSSVTKRIREIGTLRAIGWTRRAVVGQIVSETAAIGVLGGIAGVCIGFIISGIVGAVGPGLSVTTTGLTVGASQASAALGSSTTASSSYLVHLGAPIHLTTVLVALAGAIVGGLCAGAIGGWRAARLAPAVALRDLG
jgi:ABC-type antimicrobial peptide transport system permease subunit